MHVSCHRQSLLFHLPLVTHSLSSSQIEQCLKLARLLSGLHGRAARREVLELVGAVQETAAGLQNIEDRVTALADAAQVCAKECTQGLRSKCTEE